MAQQQGSATLDEVQKVKELLELIHNHYPGIRALDISQDEYILLMMKLSERLANKAKMISPHQRRVMSEQPKLYPDEAWGRDSKSTIKDEEEDESVDDQFVVVPTVQNPIYESENINNNNDIKVKDNLVRR